MHPPHTPAKPAAVFALPDPPDGDTPWVYEIATLDFGGRFHPRDATPYLRWKPYSDVALRMAGSRVSITKVTRRPRPGPTACKPSLDARGRLRLRLTDSHRQWLGLAPGDRIVVATNRKPQQVVVLNSGYLDALTSAS